jgi:hypothetical protein
MHNVQGVSAAAFSTWIIAREQQFNDMQRRPMSWMRLQSCVVNHYSDEVCAASTTLNQSATILKQKSMIRSEGQLHHKTQRVTMVGNILHLLQCHLEVS